MTEKQAIPIPTQLRLKRAMVTGMPVGFFALVCGLCAFLWQYENRSPMLVGEVEVLEHLVSSPQAGVVSQLVPSDSRGESVYVPVAKDQLLVQLDDRDVRDQLENLQRKIADLSSEADDEILRIRLQTSVQFATQPRS